jgi:hypothetical protein
MNEKIQRKTKIQRPKKNQLIQQIQQKPQRNQILRKT